MNIQYLCVIMREDIPLQVAGRIKRHRGISIKRNRLSKVHPQETGKVRKIRRQRRLIFTAGSFVKKVRHDFVRPNDFHFEIGNGIVPQKLHPPMT
jgi:hypothetical protein